MPLRRLRHAQTRAPGAGVCDAAVEVGPCGWGPPEKRTLSSRAARKTSRTRCARRRMTDISCFGRFPTREGGGGEAGRGNCWRPCHAEPGRDALEGKGPQTRPQRRVGRRLEGVAKAVGGGYSRLQMPFKPAPGIRGTAAGHRLGALEEGRGGYLPPLPIHPWAQGPEIREKLW